MRDQKEICEVVDRGRDALLARGLPYPGGDALTREELLGLASAIESIGEDNPAHAWLSMWVEAGAAMLAE